MSPRSILLLALALVCLIVAVAVPPAVERLGRSEEGTPEGRLPSKVSGPAAGSLRTRSIDGHPIAEMSLETVLRLLPAEEVPMERYRDPGDPQLDALLRRLGELRGEAGVDEVVARYGTSGCAIHAMGKVFEGWMWVDPDAATAAFLTVGPQLLEILPSPVARTGDVVHWKGQRLEAEDWGMFSRLALWELYGGVLGVATRVDPERGLALLQTPMLVADFNVLAGDYTRALDPGSDWLAVHAELTALADRMEVPMPNGWDPIPVEVAQAWAGTDWAGAMDWIMDQVGRGGNPVEVRHLAEVLGRRSVNEGMRWLEEHREMPRVDDDLLVAFAARGWDLEQKPAILKRLSSLAAEEATKDQIGFALYPGSPFMVANPSEPPGGVTDPFRVWQGLDQETGRQMREVDRHLPE